jgi:hypothetical protein
MAELQATMNVHDFRRIVLGMDGAVEGAHMNHPDFRLRGRIFASLHPDNRVGMVRLTPNQQQEFVSRSPEAFVPENGAWGRQGYTRVMLAVIDEETLGEAVTLAWQNMMIAAPLKQRTTAQRAASRKRSSAASSGRRRRRRK